MLRMQCTRRHTRACRPTFEYCNLKKAHKVLVGDCVKVYKRMGREDNVFLICMDGACKGVLAELLLKIPGCRRPQGPLWRWRH